MIVYMIAMKLILNSSLLERRLAPLRCLKCHSLQPPVFWNTTQEKKQNKTKQKTEIVSVYQSILGT